MATIYKDAKDKHVAAYVIYVDESNYAYSDSEFKNKMAAAELEDAFIKRALVCAQTSPYDPTLVAYAVPSTLIPHGPTTYATIIVGENYVYSKEKPAD